MLKTLVKRLKKKDQANAFQIQLQEEKDTMLFDQNAKNERAEERTQTERLQKMNEHLHLMLQMAAMNLLCDDEGAFVMEADGRRVHMPQAKTLFEAYLVLEEMYGEDWSTLEDTLNAPWTQEAINMILAPERYIGTWRKLHRRVVCEERLVLEKHGGEERIDERNPKLFTMICNSICEKVIDILCRADGKN